MVKMEIWINELQKIIDEARKNNQDLLRFDLDENGRVEKVNSRTDISQWHELFY